MAVYWGQAEAGKDRQSNLAFYCQSAAVDTVNLAFLSQFGKKHLSNENTKDFSINFSSQCTAEDEQPVCPDVEKDIIECQRMGKKVVLSLGGEANKREQYGFKDDEEGEQFAHTLWHFFGESHEEKNRPFGEALIDGFDFDIESNGQIGYLAMAKELKRIANEKGTKDYLFTAAPQCVYPDTCMSKLIEEFELDRLYIQFYNNKECELESDGFNFDEWVKGAVERGHSTKLYIGLPSAEQAASSGFVSDVALLNDTVGKILEGPHGAELFGGLMFWDASRGFDQDERDSEESSYIFRVWAVLNGSDEASVSSGATMSNGTTSPYTPKSTTARNGADTGLPSAFALLVLLAMCLIS